jgi:hypothetical protein
MSFGDTARAREESVIVEFSVGAGSKNRCMDAIFGSQAFEARTATDKARDRLSGPSPMHEADFHAGRIEHVRLVAAAVIRNLGDEG